MKSKLTHRTCTLALLASLAIAGCGGGDGAEPTLPTATAPATSAGTATEDQPDGSEAVSSDPDEAAAQYDRCMAEHGVKLTSADDAGQSADEGTEEDVSPDLFEKADAACIHYLEAAFGEFENDPAEQAERSDKALETAKCLKEAGYDMSVDANGQISGELDPNQDPAEFDAATKRCEGEQ